MATGAPARVKLLDYFTLMNGVHCVLAFFKVVDICGH